MCLAGASGAGAELLAALPHAGLRAHYVWVPMLPPDDEQAAVAAAERFAAPAPRPPRGAGARPAPFPPKVRLQPARPSGPDRASSSAAAASKLTTPEPGSP